VNLLGMNAWGNLGLRVARRHDPHVTGLVVADLGGSFLVALAEDGRPLRERAGDWVGIGSRALLDALAADQ
jgi:hypothetical protein